MNRFYTFFQFPFAIAIFLSLTVFMACTEKATNVTSKEIKLPQNDPPCIVYTSNPYEITGINHNLALPKMIEIYYNGIDSGRFYEPSNLLNITPQLIDYEDSVLAVIGCEANIITGIDTNSTFLSEWNIIKGTNLTIDILHEQLIGFWNRLNQNILPLHSHKDSVYVTLILNTLKNDVLNGLPLDSTYVKFLAIEQQILQECWGPNDKLALVAISVAKHSSEFWINWNNNTLGETSEKCG